VWAQFVPRGSGPLGELATTLAALAERLRGRRWLKGDVGGVVGTSKPRWDWRFSGGCAKMQFLP